MILLIDGDPIFHHFIKVIGTEVLCKCNIVLDSHYQPNTSERDVIHTLFFKGLTSNLYTTISEGMQFPTRTKVVRPFLEFGESSTYGIGKQSTACSKQISEPRLPTFIFINMRPIKE